MLEKIEFIFPKNNESIELFDLISKLLKDISYVKNREEKEIFMKLSNLKPAIVFELDDIHEIQWNIENENYLKFLNRKKNYIKDQCKIKRLLPKDVLSKLSRTCY